jgi:hypothetical protein
MIKRDQKSEWAIALGKLTESQVDEVSEGFKTSVQIAKDMKLSREQANKCITRLKRAKMLETKKFKIRTSGKHGLIKYVDHYRLITSSAKGSNPKGSASSKS